MGRCKSFDASGDGYGRGEGFNAMVLRGRGREEAPDLETQGANNDGAGVLAVVQGSAVNQDGRSSSLTAPNGPSQQVAVLVQHLTPYFNQALACKFYF